MSKMLLLIPTEFERKLYLQSTASTSSELAEMEPQLCGFGPIVAAARTTQLIAEQHPAEVVLLGIAGLYQAAGSLWQVGSAAEFSSVSCDGIGVGHGDSFQSAAEMGWCQWPGQQNLIEDRIELQPGKGVNGSTQPVGLLTVCSAASNSSSAASRQQRFPDCLGEDMEGFGVAAACRLNSVPCRVLRGFSNLAGHRDHRTWQSAAAMDAAAHLLAQSLQ